MSRKFTCYMVQVGAGTNGKFARLNDSEFRAHVVGVLAIARSSPVAGCLFVGDQEVEAIDIAKVAGVTERVAKSCLAKLKAVGVIFRDDELHCWRVHDWDDLNPEPKTDATAADRARRYRERRKQRHGTVTDPSRRDERDDHATVTPYEVEEETTPLSPRPGGDDGHGLSLVEPPPPGPPPSGNRKTEKAKWESAAVAFAHSVLPHFEPRQAYGHLGTVWMRMGGGEAYGAGRDEVRAFVGRHKPELLLVEGGGESAA